MVFRSNFVLFLFIFNSKWLKMKIWTLKHSKFNKTSNHLLKITLSFHSINACWMIETTFYFWSDPKTQWDKTSLKRFLTCHSWHLKIRLCSKEFKKSKRLNEWNFITFSIEVTFSEFLILDWTTSTDFKKRSVRKEY